MHVIGACNASPANISGGIVAIMDESRNDPDQVAVWQALLDAPAGDHMTLVELCAVASAAGGQRVDWFAAHRMVADLHVAGSLTRIVVRRTGQPKQQASALNLRGRTRLGRLLARPVRHRDQGHDVLGGFDEGLP